MGSYHNSLHRLWSAPFLSLDDPIGLGQERAINTEQPGQSHTFHWKLIEHFIPFTSALINSSILCCSVANFQDVPLPHSLKLIFFTGFELFPILRPLHSSLCVRKLSLKFGLLPQPSRDLFYISALVGKSHCSTCQEQRPCYFKLYQVNVSLICVCCRPWDLWKSIRSCSCPCTHINTKLFFPVQETKSDFIARVTKKKKIMHRCLMINNILNMLLQRFSPKVKHILPEWISIHYLLPCNVGRYRSYHHFIEESWSTQLSMLNRVTWY